MRPRISLVTRSPAALGLAALAACGGVSSDGNDNPSPTIASIAPTTGGLPGGAAVSITGTGFADNSPGENHVLVGGVEATDVNAADDATLTFTLPAGQAPGVAVDVVVFNGNGFASLPAAFTYNAQPVVTAVDPALAPPGATFTITGSGFVVQDPGENRVLLGGVEADVVDVVSDTEITATVPARGELAAFAPLDVVVTNDNGDGSLPASFRFSKPGILLATNGSLLPPSVFFLDVDVDPFQVTRLAQLDERVTGMALAPDGTVYVATNGSSGGNRLGTLDPATGRIDYIAFLRDQPSTADRVKELTFVGNTAYVFLRNAARLAAVNLTTGQYTIVGDTPLPQAGSTLGMVQRDGDTVFVATRLNEALLFVATATSVSSDGPILSGPAAKIHALVATDNGLLAVTRENVTTGDGTVPNLVRIDPTTGSVTVLGIAPAGTSAMIPTPPSFGTP